MLLFGKPFDHVQGALVVDEHVLCFNHWITKSQEMLMFVCLQKEIKQCTQCSICCPRTMSIVKRCDFSAYFWDNRLESHDSLVPYAFVNEFDGVSENSVNLIDFLINSKYRTVNLFCQH